MMYAVEMTSCVILIRFNEDMYVHTKGLPQKVERL
jgi:hypothetical protein